MVSPQGDIRGRLLRYASRLRFPKLLAITAGLFILDLLVPDMVPFVDEILLGLISLLLGSLKKRDGGDSRPPEDPPRFPRE
jgi:hypothetical protein